MFRTLYSVYNFFTICTIIPYLKIEQKIKIPFLDYKTMFNKYILLDIRDKITDLETYYNFCSVFNLNYNENISNISKDVLRENVDIFSVDFIKKFINYFDWKKISNNNKLSKNIILNFPEKLYWYDLSEKYIFDEFLLEKFKQKINWIMIFKNHRNYNLKVLKKYKAFVNMELISAFDLSEDFITEFKTEIFFEVFETFYRFNNLTEKLISENKDIINWDVISSYHQLTFDFLNKYKEDLNWYILCRDNFIDLNLIEKFSEYVDWNFISENYKLNLYILRKFKHKVNWYKISRSYCLSTELLQEFKDFLDWDIISITHYLNYNSCCEFKNKINWNLLSRNTKSMTINLSYDTYINKFKEKINWNIVLKTFNLDERFIFNYHKYIYIGIEKILVNQKISENLKNILLHKNYEDEIKIFIKRFENMDYECYKITQK